MTTFNQQGQQVNNPSVTIDQTRYKQLKVYFFPLHLRTPIILLLVGILVAHYSYQSNNSGLGALGLVAAITGATWITMAIMRYRNAPADQTVDEWLEEDMIRLMELAHQQLGLDKSQLAQKTPLIIKAPAFWEMSGIPMGEILSRKGKDRVLRFSTYRITIFLLTDHVLGAYICDYNFIRKLTLNEQTYEYHYQDIVSVATEEYSGSVTLPAGVRYIYGQRFRLSVASGESITVFINPQKLDQLENGEMPPTGAEKAVQVIRVMLREKKPVRKPEKD